MLNLAIIIVANIFISVGVVTLLSHMLDDDRKLTGPQRHYAIHQSHWRRRYRRKKARRGI